MVDFGGKLSAQYHLTSYLRKAGMLNIDCINKVLIYCLEDAIDTVLFGLIFDLFGEFEPSWIIKL